MAALDGTPSSGQDAPSAWLGAALAPLRPAYLQALLLSLGISVLGVFAAVFSLQVYDRVIAKGGLSTLVALVTGMVLAIGLEFGLRQARALLMQRLGAQVEVALARAVYERLTCLPLARLESLPPGYWQTVFRDIELVRTTTTGAPALLLVDLPFLLLTLALVGLIAWPMLPVTLLTLAGFGLLAWRSERVLKPGHAQERERLLSRDLLQADLAASRLHLKGLGPSPALGQRWEQAYARWMQDSLARSREMDHYRDLAQGMSVASTVIGTSAGALFILQQLMTMGGLIACNILAGKLVQPMVQLVGQWRVYGQFQAASRRLDELLGHALDRGQAGVALPRPRGTLLMEGLHFRYPGQEQDQISRLSGQIGPLGLHAVVGANGSGKSTLLKLLRGLYPPSAGRVLIDGADLRQFGQLDLAGMVGYLSQQPRLVAGSIRDNIALGLPGASDAQIVAAARQAGAYEFIVQLPQGFDTDVGEGGGRFSGGQRKRIAIAQTLIGDPPVLLLDEPTSDLDSVAEQAFAATLRQLAQDHTVIVVTHSPALLTQCQGILVLDRGSLAAAGPARELLPRLGLATPRPAPAGPTAGAPSGTPSGMPAGPASGGTVRAAGPQPVQEVAA
ncbi:ATP-binding cassette domain-containing protein [Ideonella sp. TBM-1]|uniref:ATP-binding cassette domain-containing protein n=1 Tax=Ideonella livida TaxID=2707176 RepID=A0A7C9TI39_9BURK|nr:ATP-binding cassette domain-containing protein [Ideonella livida]